MSEWLTLTRCNLCLYHDLQRRNNKRNVLTRTVPAPEYGEHAVRVELSCDNKLWIQTETVYGAVPEHCTC